jgi:predicted negative regulator of RcsB-dependent stress response
MAKRSRKKDHDPEDAFIAWVLEWTQWSQAHRQFLVLVGVLLVIAAGAGLYYRSYEKSLNQEAAQSMEQVQESMSLNDRQGAQSKLVTFLQRFNGTAYAGEARLLLGQIYLEANQPQQAEAVLKPIGESPKTPIGLQAAALLGAAYEQEKRWDDAEQVYLRIADRSKLDFEVREALDDAARIRVQQGDTSGAVDLYKRILASLDPTDPNRNVYQMRIEELSVKPVTEAPAHG